MATMKIAAHTILEILGFSDIDNLAVFIFMDITTRAIWQQLQFMFNQFIHDFIIAKRLLHCLLGRLGKKNHSRGSGSGFRVWDLIKGELVNHLGQKSGVR